MAMTAALFAGCGSEEDTSGPAQETGDRQGAENQGDTEGQEDTDGTEGTEGEDSQAEDEEVAEIRVALMSFSPTEMDVQQRVQDAINEKLEEMINVRVELVWSTADYGQQLPMMLQAGEDLDLVMFTPIPSAGFSSLMSQGQLMDITDYIEKYGPDIKAVLGEEGLAATSREGRIYGVGGNMCHYGGEGIAMRKDVLEDIDMVEKFENMTTWTELEEILTAAVAAGHGGVINSDAEGSCITPQPFMNGSDKLEEAYWVDVVGDGNQQVYVDPADDKVKCFFMNEDYKASLIRAGEWYDKGLIYKDAATAEDYAATQLKNQVGSCLINAQEFGWEGTLTSSVQAEVMMKFTGAFSKTATTSYTKFGYGVPVTSKEPEAAIKFLNLMYSQNEIHDTLAWGVEGIDWVKNEDGTAGYPNGGDSSEYHKADFLFGDILTVTPWADSGAGVREEQASLNAEVEFSKYIGFAIDNTNVVNQVTACQNVMNEFKPMLSSGVYGADGTEAKYEEFMTALEAAGINEILEEYQSQLDAWLASNQS